MPICFAILYEIPFELKKKTYVCYKKTEVIVMFSLLPAKTRGVLKLQSYFLPLLDQ